MNVPISVCQVVASVNLRTGGPAVSVPALADRLAGCGVESWIATLDYPGLGPMAEAPRARFVVERPSTLGRALRGCSPRFACRLGALARRQLDIVHNHGLWMHPNIAARRSARAARIPLVISPRGMLEPWSMQFGAAKKRAAWIAYERRNLRAAAAFHATSQDEAQSIRRVGLRAPIAVVPNGVDVDAFAAPARRDVLEQQFPELRGKRWVLFLSRLHRKKGADLLVDAWCGLAAQFPDAHLVLAGPDEEGMAEALRARLADGRCDDRASIVGPLEGAEKSAALGNASLLVLPTASENFGIVVAEALASGVPVLTTRGTPWRELEDERCGWWIEQLRDALEAALRAALAMPSDELKAMGARGRALVERRYSHDEAASRMASVYRWILGVGERPTCVVAD